MPRAWCQPRSHLTASTAPWGQAVAHRLRRVRAAAQGHPSRSPAPRCHAGWQPLLPVFVWEQAQAGALSCLKSPGGGGQATVLSPPSHSGPHAIFPGGNTRQRGRGTGWSVPPTRWLCAGGTARAPRLPVRPWCRKVLGVRGASLLPWAGPRILRGRSRSSWGSSPTPPPCLPVASALAPTGSWLAHLLAHKPPVTKRALPVPTHSTQPAPPSGPCCPAAPGISQHTHAAELSLCPGVLPKSGQASALFRTANVPSGSRGPGLGGAPGVGSVWAPQGCRDRHRSLGGLHNTGVLSRSSESGIPRSRRGLSWLLLRPWGRHRSGPLRLPGAAGWRPWPSCPGCGSLASPSRGVPLVRVSASQLTLQK